MLENYRCCLLHEIAFHFIILRIFSFRACIWSGDYSDFTKNAVQPLDRWDLKFFLFQVFFKLQLKVINTNVFLQLTFVQNQQQKH